MNKGNLENVLGGTFVALPGLNGEVEDNVDHGPAFVGIDLPDKVFEKTFDGELLENMRKHAPKYKEWSGRFDPFEYDRMKMSVGTWSVLVDKSLVTFTDACEHALALCRLWVQEDEELAKIAEVREKREVEKEVAAKTNILVEGSKEYEIEQARLEWREAVKKRNEITKQWNEYVNAKRSRYHELRDN